jgi:hypothetical protein
MLIAEIGQKTLQNACKPLKIKLIDEQEESHDDSPDTPYKQ